VVATSSAMAAASSTLAHQASSLSAFTAIRLFLRQMVGRMRVDIQHRGMSAALAAVVAAAALLLGRRQQRERKLEEPQCLASHPLVAWFLENFAIIGVTVFSMSILPPPRQTALGVLAVSLPTHFLQVWLSMAVMGVVTHGIYSHVPRFGETGRPKTTLRYLIWDFMRSNFATSCGTVGPIAAIVAQQPARMFAHANPAKVKISPLGFMVKLAIVRVCVDVGFYLGHRALHHRSLYWVHRYHHSHYKPVIGTNFHFSPLDLLIEASLPVAFGLVTLDAIGLYSTTFEKSLLVGYIGWHEQGSHCAKPLPAVTYFPPFAPLYQLLLGPVDKHNVRHHDVHHSLLNCNYGITIWPDIVMGTRVQKDT